LSKDIEDVIAEEGIISQFVEAYLNAAIQGNDKKHFCKSLGHVVRVVPGGVNKFSKGSGFNPENKLPKTQIEYRENLFLI